MGLQERFCPECGQKIKVDINKSFCFCSNCGYKILLASGSFKEKREEIKEEQIKDKQKKIVDLEEKIEEAHFYFQLSLQKKEALNLEKNPTYYLKAQDILVDLAEMFADDYRIWWELSKPLDFSYEDEANDYENHYRFNDENFSKALDKASIENKKKLIEYYEKYNEKKQRIRQAYIVNKKKLEEEEERIRKETERQKKKEEAEKHANELEKQRALENQIVKENIVIWEQLEKNELSLIDGCFFCFTSSDNKKYTGVLRVISNILYLMSFYEDSLKGVIYREQSITVRIGGKGIIAKYNGQPVRIKNCRESDLLVIHSKGYGKLGIGNLELVKNVEFVNDLMKRSKKPLIAGKVFI